jgi:hypothetical protein
VIPWRYRPISGSTDTVVIVSTLIFSDFVIFYFSIYWE